MSLDKRSRRLVFVAHCVLNQNVRFLGGAHYPAVMEEVVDLLRACGVGLVQMPCPEFDYAGLSRPARAKEEYDTPKFREHCRKIAASITDQAEEYMREGFQVLAVLGIERSPSCGVGQTTTRLSGPAGEAKATDGQGIFIEELQREFTARQLQVPFKGLDWRTFSEEVHQVEQLRG